MLKSLKITHKFFLLSFASILGFVLLLTIFNVTLSKNSRMLESLQFKLYPALTESQANVVRLNKITEDMENAVMMGELEILDETLTLKDEINKSLNSLIGYDVAQSEVTALKQALENYHSQAYTLANKMIDGDIDMAELGALAARSNEQFETTLSLFQAQRNRANDAIESNVNATSTDTASAQVTALALGISVIVITGILTMLLARTIITALKSVTRSLEDIAQGEGDLTVQLKYDGEDELAELVDHFNQFISKIRHMVAQTVDSVEQIQQTSSQLAQLTSQATNNIGTQSSAIDQTTTALSEMFESIRHIATHASQASTVANDAKLSVEEGNALMTSSIDSTNKLADEVEHTSEEITRLEHYRSNVGLILDTIRSIAEQTNLLALNAAIEAARAGEQGRGFAVVADEVRSLASRTQDSTAEIQQVLEELQQASEAAVTSIEQGAKIAQASVEKVNQSGEAINSIHQQVSSINDINTQIATATEQQNQTSEILSQYVNDIKELTSQSIQSMSELEQVSHALQSMNATINDTVNQFKI